MFLFFLLSLAAAVYFFLHLFPRSSHATEWRLTYLCTTSTLADKIKNRLFFVPLYFLPFFNGIGKVGTKAWLPSPWLAVVCVYGPINWPSSKSLSRSCVCVCQAVTCSAPSGVGRLLRRAWKSRPRPIKSVQEGLRISHHARRVRVSFSEEKYSLCVCVSVCGSRSVDTDSRTRLKRPFSANDGLIGTRDMEWWDKPPLFKQLLSGFDCIAYKTQDFCRPGNASRSEGLFPRRVCVCTCILRHTHTWRVCKPGIVCMR